MIGCSGLPRLFQLAVAGLLAFCCAACAGQRPAPDSPRESVATVENCPVLYVLAPGNYIVDLAANARVRLDPAWHEFELYCSLAEAGAALDDDARLGKKLREQWRIYTLAGNANELAAYEAGKRVLKAPAILDGWENWPAGTK